MTQELKPCPFCANSAHLCDDLITFYAQCDSCTASGALSSYSTGAAIAWNTRALTAAQPAQAAGSQWCDHCGRVVIASCGSNDHATRCILGLTQPAQAGEVDAREAFERAALAKWGPLDFERSEAVPEMYYNQRLDDAWIGFGFAVTWLRASLPASQQATPEPVGEVVAWQRRDRNIVTGEWSEWHEDDDIEEELDPEWAERRPLFTRPAPGVPEGFALVPMTEDQVWHNDSIMSANAIGGLKMDAVMRIVRGVEAHHSERLAAAQANGGCDGA